MKNKFVVEGNVVGVEDKVSKNGNNYQVVSINAGDQTPKFVFFNIKANVGDSYRVEGKVTVNEKGYTNLSVQAITAVSAKADKPAASNPAEEDDDLPF